MCIKRGHTGRGGGGDGSGSPDNGAWRQRNKSNNYKTNRIQCARIASGKRRRRNKKCEKKESLCLSTRMLRTLWQQQAHTYTLMYTHTQSHTVAHSHTHNHTHCYTIWVCFLRTCVLFFISPAARIAECHNTAVAPAPSPSPSPLWVQRYALQRHRQTASNYKATARVRVPLWLDLSISSVMEANALKQRRLLSIPSLIQTFSGIRAADNEPQCTVVCVCVCVWWCRVVARASWQHSRDVRHLSTFRINCAPLVMPWWHANNDSRAHLCQCRGWGMKQCSQWPQADSLVKHLSTAAIFTLFPPHKHQSDVDLPLSVAVAVAVSVAVRDAYRCPQLEGAEQTRQTRHTDKQHPVSTLP